MYIILLHLTTSKLISYENVKVLFNFLEYRFIIVTCDRTVIKVFYIQFYECKKIADTAFFFSF